MNVKGILFDKDGTLLDFDAFWVGLSRASLTELLESRGYDASVTEEVLQAFGVEDGVTDIDGILCKGTYEQMAQVLYEILLRHGEKDPFDRILAQVLDTYNRNFDKGEIKAACPELRKTLEALKEKKIKLAVVTTDNAVLTGRCLETLGILDLFDAVYTDDGTFPAKPCPDCAVDFMTRMGLTREELLMVGDTMTDVNFARNAGIPAVAVAKSLKNRQRLQAVADVVLEDVSCIPAFLASGSF